MSEHYTVISSGNTLKMILNPKSEARLALGAFLTIVFYALTAYVVYNIVTAKMEHATGTGRFVVILFMLAFSSIYFFAARALLRRITYQQVIEIDKKVFSITDKYLFSKSTKQYDISKIETMAVAPAGNYTRHQLETNSVEMGFGVREAVIRDLTSDGSILMVYNNRDIRFGRNIPSWDVEAILMVVGSHMGREFVSKVDIDFDEE